MNPLIREASGSVAGGWVLGLVTLVFILSFLWWCWYAYTPKHREMHEASARMPLDDGGAQ